jgi:lipopolysaccharide export system protein LptC
MQDKDVVNVTANSGTYTTKADKVVLRDQVVVTSQQGYKAVLHEAAIEMKKGNVVSEQPVDITLPNGWLKSNRMEIEGSGDVVRFDRGVTLYIEADKSGASQ